MNDFNLQLIQQLIIDLNNSKRDNYFQIFNSDSYDEENQNYYEINKMNMSEKDFENELETKGFHKFDKPIFSFNENTINNPDKSKLNKKQIDIITKFIKDWQKVNDVIEIK